MPTTTEHPNVTLLRAGYEAFGAGDMERLRSELLAPDIVWHQGGDNPTSGDYAGIDQVLGLFLNLFQQTGGTFRVALTQIAASGDLVFGIGVASGSRTGKTMDAEPYIHVARVRDGKMAESWILNLDQPAVDAFYRD